MNRHGVTLVELIVVLAIVAVIAGVTTLAFRRTTFAPHAMPWASAIAAARRIAIDSSRAVTISISIGDTLYAVTALSDGCVIGDGRLGIDRLTGEVQRGP